MNSESKGKVKIIIAVVLVVLLVGGGVGAGFYKQYKSRPEVVLSDVVKGSVSQHYSTTAQVKAKNQTVFEALDGVIVKTVDVKVGDVVNEGDLLATFDTSALGGNLEQKKKDWDRAKTTYDDAVEAAKNAEVELPKIQQQIADLEKKIEEDKTSTTVTEQASAPESTQATEPSTSSGGGILDSIISSITGGSGTSSQLQQLIDALNGLSNMGDLSSMISPDQIGSLLNSGMSGMSDQAQLVQLQAQKAVYDIITTESYLNAQKDRMDKAESEYRGYEAALNMLKEGWTADCYGIVSEVNLTAGETYVNETERGGGLDFSSLAGFLNGSGDTSSLISAIAGFSSSSNDSGALTIENYNQMYIDFTVGKYDMENVKLGQKATIEYLDRTYSGTVSYISAVATESEGIDLGAMVGSLTGGGGSTTGADATVTIDNPDNGLVIGFDADISIETGKATDVLTIPVEALRVSGNERYVFVYNPENKEVEKRVVTVGLSGEDNYEIKDGLAEGEKVVKIIKGTGVTLEDGVKVKTVEK